MMTAAREAGCGTDEVPAIRANPSATMPHASDLATNTPSQAATTRRKFG